ncbi:MAG: S8 family serine peptidase [Planctomycetota bacterium]
MRRQPLVLVLSLGLLVIPACGGGGGGGSTGPRIAGQLTIPDLSSGRGPVIGEREDDEGFTAVRTPFLESGVTLFGEVGGADPLDVRRLTLPTGSFEVSIRAGSHGILIESRTGRQLARWDDAAQLRVDVSQPGDIDLAFAARDQGTEWSASVRRIVGSSSDADAIAVPTAPDAITQRSPLLAQWLGADHPMVAGEILVYHTVSANGVPVAPLDLTALGLEPVREGSGGALVVHRIALANTVATRAAGAASEWSLEAETALAALRVARQPGVRAAAPNFLRRALSREPNDTYYNLQWHYAQLKMDQAWSLTTGSAGIVVGVIDTGIVSAHPEFSGRLVQGYDFISSATRARDGNGIDPDPEDEGDLSQPPNSSWHGTHVAGTIGANTDNGSGVAGMDWSCKIMALRALGLGGGSSADILQAVMYSAGMTNSSGTTPQPPAVPKGRCDVVNMSLGGPGGSAVEEQVYADVRGRGVLVVVAAGNESTDSPSFPAAYDSNLSVGAVRFDKALAPYSNFGTTVDVVAPGGDLTVDQNGDNFGDGVLSCLVDASRTPVFGFQNGTSMAAPHVAGLASLMLGLVPTLSASQLFDAITQNVEDLGTAGRDSRFGEGLIDPPAALAAVSNSVPTTPILSVTPNGVNFDPTQSQASLALANAGIGSLVVDTGGSSIQFAAGQPTGWLSMNFVAVSATDISHNRLDLTVDRTGLPNGKYNATITVASTNATSKNVTVSMDVGSTANTDTIFVLLVDADSFDTVFQAETDATKNFEFIVQATGAAPIPDGDYLLVAGTDRDNDDIIGDDGELFGIWPNTDSPQLVSVTSQTVNLTDLDFALEPVSQISGAGHARRSHRLLR